MAKFSCQLQVRIYWRLPKIRLTPSTLFTSGLNDGARILDGVFYLTNGIGFCFDCAGHMLTKTYKSAYFVQFSDQVVACKL